MKKGFTIIELLVIVAITGIMLTPIVLTSISGLTVKTDEQKKENCQKLEQKYYQCIKDI